MASLSDQAFRQYFTVPQPDTLTQYIPETARKEFSKKMKKKNKVKGILQGGGYTSTNISEIGDLNGVETHVPKVDIIPEPEAETVPAEESFPEEEAPPEEKAPPEADDVPEVEAVPEEDVVSQEQQHFGYGYDYTMRQNNGKTASNRSRRGADPMIPLEVAESTVTVEQEVTPSPLYLPFSAQHRLMVHLQHKLEAICFSFGQKHMPEKLQEAGWDCPEAVELNAWTNEFRFSRPFRERVPKKRRIALLNQVSNIRNYAVSRTRIDSAELEKVLDSAAKLAMYLGEDRSLFEKLQEEVVNTNNWLGEETDQLQKKLDAKLEVIAAARAKVDALEESTRVAFDKGLLKRQNAAHAKVLMAIERAEVDQPVAVTDCSVAPSSLDWVNGLENSLMLGDDIQEESWT